MGLKRYVDLPEETAKINEMLIKIGALAEATFKGKLTKVVRLNTLLAAMNILGYDYSTIKEKVGELEVKNFDMKSIRIMNRLTRTVGLYQGEYQKKAKAGVEITIS